LQHRVQVPHSRPGAAVFTNWVGSSWVMHLAYSAAAGTAERAGRSVTESRYGPVMPAIHVCSLSRLHETVRAVDASHVVTLINVNTVVERPKTIGEDRHLFIGVSDITAPMEGHITPGEEHVARLMRFVNAWDQTRPMVIHCWAGVSRSTAAAFISTCMLRPERDEFEIARDIRRLSPSATPNARLVALADAALRRGGRMSAAVDAIGRGADCFEGIPFSLHLR
jgi:predicted protein tyrosine phosphatase